MSIQVLQRPTLVLNRSWQPVNVATVERALIAEGLDPAIIVRTPLVDPIPLPATAVRRIEIRFIGQARD